MGNAENVFESAATKLRRLIESNDGFIIYDNLSARIAMEVGFDGLYMV